MKKLFSILLITCFLVPSAFAAKKAAGVSFQEKSGENLLLNGLGVRKKSFVKVYACGLYLQEKSNNASEIINKDEEMAIRLVITTGLVSKEKMQNAMTEGFETSTNGNTEPLKAEIADFNKCFNDEIVKQDEFFISYSPDKGVVVTKNGVEKGVIKGIEFKKALFGIWLGDNATDKKLKKMLLN